MNLILETYLSNMLLIILNRIIIGIAETIKKKIYCAMEIIVLKNSDERKKLFDNY